MNPGLFGIKKSNRDFSLKRSWGKNQFNSAFPAALACYFFKRELKAAYLRLDKELSVTVGEIKISDVFGINPLAEDAFYAFESPYSPYQSLVVDDLPRIDLVISRIVNGLAEPIRGIEMKLTALPDNQSAEAGEENYGSEIVVRPDTVVYAALSVAVEYLSDRKKLLSHFQRWNTEDWSLESAARSRLAEAADILDAVLIEKISSQKPLLLQPVWKTEQKTLILHENCLDIFVWSDFALTRLFVDVCRRSLNRESITRHSRTVLWLSKMLFDFANEGKISPGSVIDELTYGTKNDKAFSVSGKITRQYMKSPALLKPRIKRREIKNIILGGGERFLSPERRFDAALLSARGLF